MSKTLSQAEELWKNGLSGRNLISELIAVVIYMRDYLNYKPMKRKEELINYLTKYKQDYDYNKDYKIINLVINKSKNKNIKLFDYKPIFVPEYVLNFFQQLEYEYDYKKTLFVFYCYYLRSLDVCNQLNKEKKGYSINIDSESIKKIKKSINYAKQDKDINEVMHVLYLDGYIIPYSAGTGMYLDFIKIIIIPDNNNIGGEGLKFNDLENAGWYFDNYNGIKTHKICIECGKIFKIAKHNLNNPKIIRCKKCNVIHRREYLKNYRKTYVSS